MMPEEKDELLALLTSESCWCREAEAVNSAGDPVRFNDQDAVAWDLTGALCRLFGWERACVLFGQLDRHLNGRRTAAGWPPATDAEMDAMAALQDFNDRPDTTFALLRERLEQMPVWHGAGRANGPVSGG